MTLSDIALVALVVGCLVVIITLVSVTVPPLIRDVMSQRRERREWQHYNRTDEQLRPICQSYGCDACRQWLAAHPENGGAE